MKPERSFVLGEVYKWIEASSILLIFSQILLLTMLRDSDGAMLLRLLGLLVLSSLCSAMWSPDNNTSKAFPEGSGMGDYGEMGGGMGNGGGMGGGMGNGGGMGGGMGNGGGMGGGMGDGGEMGPGGMRKSWNNTLKMVDPNMPSMPNTAICDMLMNAPVPPPIDQIPYFCLCWHCKGAAGPKGDHGPRGLPGIPGSPGRRGMTGFPGHRGFTGMQGIKGQKGDFGEKGHLGPAGFTGMKGMRGFKGEKGDAGMEGPAGSEGPKGDTGTCPASCESVPGEKGHQGPPGPVGGRGLPGVKGSMGPKGMLGDKGHMGRPGDTGTNGMKGDQGEQGVCECTDGADGADGSHGDKGTKGDKGDIGMKGELGNMGLKGDEGMMGLMGVPGPCSPAIQSAFSACINQSYPAPNWPVSFPKVLTNQQGHFNADMGIYTAPINGTYLFTFNLAVALKPLTAGLFNDHYPKVIVTALTDQSTTSQTIVLHLSMGSMVWLQVKNNYTNGMYTSYESSSTFSGYLVHPDSCEMPLGRGIGPLPTMPSSYKWDTATTTTTPAP